MVPGEICKALREDRGAFVFKEMAKDFARKFYYSKEWQSCRNAYIKKRIAIDGGLCERCGKRLGYIVHHSDKITEQNANNPDVLLSHSNLEYVCFDCHNEIHAPDMNAGKMKRARCEFDESGQPIDTREV